MSLAVLLLSLSACKNQYVIEDGGTDPVGTDPLVEEEPDYAEYDGATLVITTPASGAFLPYGEASAFAAEVRDVEGNVMDFEDIAWTSDIDTGWALAGASLEDDGLDVGTHAISAVALLPNGDRLAYTIGGVLVQSAYTGIYTGTVQVDTAFEYNDTTYEAGCSGAITLVVDAYGETAAGDAGCLLSLLGYDLDTAYVFDLENDAGDLYGTAALDLSFYQYEIEAAGEITEDGTATVSFSEFVLGYVQLDGVVEVTRVSRDISDYQE